MSARVEGIEKQQREADAALSDEDRKEARGYLKWLGFRKREIEMAAACPGTIAVAASLASEVQLDRDQTPTRSEKDERFAEKLREVLAERDPRLKANFERARKKREREERERRKARALAYRTVVQVLKDPPPSWLVRSVLQDKSLAGLYGKPNAGKSFVALDIACAVARGEKWMGRSVAGGLAVYVMLEGSARLRVEGYLRHHRLKTETLADLVVVRDGFSLQDAENVERLYDTVKLIEEERGATCRLLVIDTLARTIGESENDAQAMARAIEHLEALARHCAVLFVHHGGKDDSRGMRGHSSLLGAVDTVLKVEARENGERVIQIEKQRDADLLAACAFRLEVIELGTDEEGETITSCAVVPIKGVPARKAKPLGAVQKTVLDALQALLAMNGGLNSVPVETLVEAAKPHLPRGGGGRDKRREHIFRAITALKADGRVHLYDDPASGAQRVTTEARSQFAFAERRKDELAREVGRVQEDRARRDAEFDRLAQSAGGSEPSGLSAPTDVPLLPR